MFLSISFFRPAEPNKAYSREDYMLHKMDKLSIDDRDIIVDSKGNLIEILSNVLSLIVRVQLEQREDGRVLNSVWQMFILSFELGLWELTQQPKTTLAKIFKM